MTNIREKKRKERELLYTATEQLYGSILWKKKEPEKDEGKAQTQTEALFQILDYFHLDRPEFDVPPEEVSFDDLLRRSGLMMRRIQLRKGWWMHSALPMIVTDEKGDGIAMVPGKGNFYLEMTENGPVRLTATRVGEIHSLAYCFYKPLAPDKTGMKEFWKFIATSITSGDIAMVLVISLFLELSGLILPYLNQTIYNNVIPSVTAKEIPGIMVLLVSTAIFSCQIFLARSICVTRIGSKMRIAGQSAIWNRLFTLPMPFIRSYDAGELYNRALAVNTICDILGGGLIPAALTALLSFIYLLQIRAFASCMVIPSFIIIVVMLANITVAGFMQIRLSRVVNEKNNRVTSFLYQIIGGITKIRTAGAEVRAYAKWAEKWKELPLMPPVFLQVSGVFGLVISICGNILLYSIAWKEKLPASTYIAFQTSFASFAASVLTLADFGLQFGALKPAIDMVRPIMDTKPEIFTDREYVNKLDGKLELMHLKFRYTPDMPYVLDGLSLSIQPGEYLGIVGSSGCGKSTLMKMILGFETAESGSVYFDGKNIINLDLQSLRRRIGVVLQSGSLFSGDIYSNIAICAPALTMDGAWDAARRAGVAEDIEKMPMGMYTMLSEDGGGVSGGQKQRILIARAIASNPDILLFDEATSALDNRTQETVVNTLKEMHCTRLVIAHRLSTVKDCDRIIYLDKGKIIESGTYDELMNLGGMFAKMAVRQLT